MTEISGSFTIRNNAAMVSLSGLDQLSNIGDSLAIVQNPALQNMLSENTKTGFKSLDNLEYLGGNLAVRLNNTLVSVEGLNSLSYIGGSLILDANAQLVDISGLGLLDSIGEYLWIHQNNSLATLSGLDHIASTSISGLIISDNSTLETCHVKSVCDYLAAPAGTVEIHDNAPGCNSAVEVEDACQTSIDENSNTKNRVLIFPNPADHTITIHGPFKLKEISIFDQTGKLVKYSDSGVNNLNVSNLHPGLYFIEIRTDKGMVREKLILY